MADHKKRIIIAPKEYLPLLFRWKNAHPLERVKFITPSDLLDLVSFRFKADPIPSLIQKGIAYTKAKKYVRLFRLCVLDGDLKAKFDLLPEGITETDPYGEKELKEAEVAFLELQEDKELHGLLDRHGIPYADITLEQLGIKPKRKENEFPEIRHYPDKYSLFFDLFASMREKLLQDPKKADALWIHNASDGEFFFLSAIGNLFGIPCRYRLRKSFAENTSVKEKLKVIYERRSFAFSINELDDEALLSLRSLIESYGLGSLDFDFAYANLLEILSTIQEQTSVGKEGISCFNNFGFASREDAELYITDFQQGDFYTEYKDDDVYNDEELVRLGANPSYVKTMLDRRLKLNFLRFQNIAFLARPLRHLDESLYDSQFVKELKLKPIKTEMGVAGVHTAVSSSLRKASAYDAKRVKKTVGEYRSYDHSFKGITTPVLEEGHTYSVTDINRYILCPYAYYMKKVLPRIGNDEHRMWRGTLIHKVLETIYDENFDFDAQFDIAKAGYLKTLKDEGVTYDGKEKLNLALWECGLRIVTQELRSKTGKAKVSENLVEMPIEFTLTDGDHNSYLFHGRIDQILVTYSDVESYYTIIDNKSGSERFSPHALMFGYGIQLPMYQAAIASSFEEKGKFGGFAIQPVFFSSQKQMGTTKKDLDRNLLLGGVALKDDLYQQSLGEFDAEKEKDPRCWDKNTMGFTAIDAEENIIGEVSGLEQYNVQDMLDDAALGALRTIHAIAERDFRIAPTSDDLAGNQAQLPCRYCDYADVCYRKKSKDTTVYWGEIKEHFKLK